jgi:hypothetical protein
MARPADSWPEALPIDAQHEANWLPGDARANASVAVEPYHWYALGRQRERQVVSLSVCGAGQDEYAGLRAIVPGDLGVAEAALEIHAVGG